MRVAGDPQVHGRWWGRIGILGVSLVLPGGLVLLLYLMVRARTRTDSVLQDPYVAWLQMRYRLRAEWRPGADAEANSEWRESSGRPVSDAMLLLAHITPLT